MFALFAAGYFLSYSFRSVGALIGPDLMRMVEKSLLLQVFDAVWKEHLLALDHLRQGIGLRAYGQRDPLNEYKAEAFSLFEAMSQSLREAVTANAESVRADTALPLFYGTPEG